MNKLSKLIVMLAVIAMLVGCLAACDFLTPDNGGENNEGENNGGENNGSGENNND